MAKTDVAALLAHSDIAKLSESANEVSARDDGQLGAHRVTTTLPISTLLGSGISSPRLSMSSRSEEHTSELQSRLHLVCRLLLEKKKKTCRPGPLCRHDSFTMNIRRNATMFDSYVCSLL